MTRLIWCSTSRIVMPRSSRMRRMSVPRVATSEWLRPPAGSSSSRSFGRLASARQGARGRRQPPHRRGADSTAEHEDGERRDPALPVRAGQRVGRLAPGDLRERLRHRLGEHAVEFGAQGFGVERPQAHARRVFGVLAQPGFDFGALLGWQLVVEPGAQQGVVGGVHGGVLNSRGAACARPAWRGRGGLRAASAAPRGRARCATSRCRSECAAARHIRHTTAVRA